MQLTETKAVKHDKGSEITAGDVQHAIRMVFSGTELAKHAAPGGTKAVTKFTSEEEYQESSAMDGHNYHPSCAAVSAFGEACARDIR